MQKKFRDRLNAYSIRRKIGMVYGIGIIPIILVLLISVVIILQYVILNSIKLSVNNNSQIIIDQIEEKVKNAESCANIMLGYLNEVDFLKENGNKNIDKLQMHNEVLKKMTFSYQVFSNIDGMVFIDNEENIYGDNYQIEECCKKKDMKELVSLMKKKGGKPMWFPMSQENSLSKIPGNTTLTMGKNIIDIETGESLGTLFITIAEPSINQVYRNLKISENSYYVVVNKNGNVVSSPNDNEIGEEYLVKNNLSKQEMEKGYIAQGRYIYTKNFDDLPYVLLFQAPLMELAQNMIKIIGYVIVLGSACSFFALYLSNKLGRRITQPIITLSDAMNQVIQGDLETRCNINSLDETRLIGDGFNKMLDTIAQLMENVKMEQNQKRKYELALMQSQIKPHFLYNTLDTIYILSHMKKNEEAKKIAKALADYYRVSLSAGREIISLDTEIKCTIDYLKILEMRYADEFTYQINVEDGLLDYSILKLTLQPLVENAVYHGLKEKKSKGMLEIYSEQTEEDIWICIKDNGVGMSLEKQKQLFEKETTASFGIKNLNDRIHVYFGESYGLLILSEEGKGTIVKVHIPKKKEDALND